MHKYFTKDSSTSPGRLSEAYLAGMENQHSTHSGKWDRNLMVAAMLEIKLSMTGHAIDKINFDSLGLWDRICGGAPNIAISSKDHTGAGPAGYRVPTSPQYDPNLDTYNMNTGGDDVPVTDFSPLVAYGSLESLRSMRMGILASCPEGFLPSDGLAYQYCQNEQHYLAGEMLRRAEYAPFLLQRDIWCDPHKHVSIEQSVGNPEYFDEDLYDTEVKDRFRLDNLVVNAFLRGEEDIADKTWVKRSLYSWVYVTSSADRNVRAGMYRLIDLPVFREQSCSTLPNVQCSAGTAFTEIENPAPAGASPAILQIFRERNFYYRTVRTDEITRINSDLPLVDGLGTATSWRIGREALPMYRCSQMLTTYLGTDPCEHTPYQTPSRAQCSTFDLTLQSRPTMYGSKHWLLRLAPLPSPSPPPPPPNPRPPPGPPSPNPPPAPPYRYSQNEVMAAIRGAEERMCTSVYYLSQTTRCERLAIELTQRWLMEFYSPPSIPPLSAISPSPPPSPPPSPYMPAWMRPVTVTGAILSTFRIPVALPVGIELDTFGYYTTDLAAIKTALSTTDQLHRACVVGSPLGCQTASFTELCLNGGRRCGTSTENAENPYVETRFKLTDSYYLWGIKVKLPRNTQLAERFIGTKTIEVWGIRDEPLPCAEGGDEVVGVPENYELTIVCHLPTATDAQLYAMSGAYRVRMTLTGTFRQVWLEGVEPLERPLSEAGVRTAPSPPPPLPHHPPSAPCADTGDYAGVCSRAVSDGGCDCTVGTIIGDNCRASCECCASPPPPSPPPCTFFANTWVDSTVSVRRTHEPCGITKEACCAHKQEHEAEGAGAFEIDDAGCCSLLYFDAGVALTDVTVGADTDRQGAYATRSGTGA